MVPNRGMNLAPIQVEHAHGRCLADERRMAFTLSRACPSPRPDVLLESAVGRFAGDRKKDRGPEEGRSRTRGESGKSPDGRPFPHPQAGRLRCSARLGRSVLKAQSPL